jgi:hypothetical protein
MKTGHSYKLLDIVTSSLIIESFQKLKDRIPPNSHLKNAVRIQKMFSKIRQFILAKGAER